MKFNAVLCIEKPMNVYFICISEEGFFLIEHHRNPFQKRNVQAFFLFIFVFFLQTLNIIIDWRQRFSP